MFQNVGLGSDLLSLVKSLSENSSLTHLNLRGKELFSETTSSGREANLSAGVRVFYSSFSVQLVRSIFQSPSSQITFLGIGDSFFDREGTMELCRFLRKSQCRLSSLDLSRNLLGDECVREIADALVENRALTRLDIGGEGKK